MLGNKMQEIDFFFPPRDTLSSPSVASVKENKFHFSQWKPKDGNIKGCDEHTPFLSARDRFPPSEQPTRRGLRVPSLPCDLGEPDPAALAGRSLVTLAWACQLIVHPAASVFPVTGFGSWGHTDHLCREKSGLTPSQQLPEKRDSPLCRGRGGVRWDSGAPGRLLSSSFRRWIFLSFDVKRAPIPGQVRHSSSEPEQGQAAVGDPDCSPPSPELAPVFWPSVRPTLWHTAAYKNS